MVCKKCGQQIPGDAAFCIYCGAPTADIAEKKNEDDRIPPKTNRLIILVIIIGSILVMASMFAVGYMLLINSGDKNSDEKSDAEYSYVTERPAETEEAYFTQAPSAQGVMETPKPTPKPTPTPTPMPTVRPESSAAVNPYMYNNMSFAYGKTIPQNCGHIRYDNYDYSYYCYVPEMFIQTESRPELYAFKAEDNTAYVCFTATTNTYGYTVEKLMNEHISKLGGTVEYKASGDDWFALSVKKNGECYYIKGFVDHYVRMMFLEFPAEYTDGYKGYLEYMEDHYKRTD